MSKLKETIIAKVNIKTPVEKQYNINYETLHNYTKNVYDLVVREMEEGSSLKVEVTYKEKFTESFQGAIIADLVIKTDVVDRLSEGHIVNDLVLSGYKDNIVNFLEGEVEVGSVIEVEIAFDDM